MKPLNCRCGQTIFFDNLDCLNCGRALAFDPRSLTMQAEELSGDGLNFCAHRGAPLHCNWLAPEGGKCLSCRSSDVIPALTKRANRERWRRLEYAKRRLIYDLLHLGLPVEPNELSFEFKEDRRTNPAVWEEHVAIGHFEGVITINAAEADNVFREQMRQSMNEPYRTLLGHFRHESGHYYQNLVLDEEGWTQCRQLFGDEKQDYDQALKRHYEQGPPRDWSRNHISAYAAAHPLEDWAECWAHYLHVQDFLETAVTQGLITRKPDDGESEANWLDTFRRAAVGINEMMRSLGLSDAYPFVINPPVADKLDLIHRAVIRRTSRPAAP